MRLTAVVPGADGMGLTPDKSVSILREMYRGHLGPGDDIEAFDIDDLTFVQHEDTVLFHRDEPVRHHDRVYVVCNVSTCPQRERRLHRLFQLLLERGAPLVNRSFGATPELEVNKALMHAVVSRLGIACIPTIELNPHAPVGALIELVERARLRFPLVLKPNRLMMGEGIMLARDHGELRVQVSVLRRLVTEYLVQAYVPSTADIRVYASRDRVFCLQARETPKDDIRANLSLGARSTQRRMPPDLVEPCLRIARRCDADVLAIDWLETDGGFVFNEMSSAVAGWTGVPFEERQPLVEAVVQMCRRELERAASGSTTHVPG